MNPDSSNENQPRVWSAVDEYFAAYLAPHDDALESALRTSAAAGLPGINVTATQGKLLHMLVRLANGRRVLEIGTLGGYSAIWMARAIPGGGTLVTLEINPAYAEVARQNLERAGVADRVELMVAPASESLQRLAEQAAAPFDLVFIDADKASSATYFAAALQLSRPGTIIVVDNVVREGAVVDAENNDPSVQGVRELIDLAARTPRVSSTAIQTVGSKGYDGFLLAIVNADTR